MALFKIFKGNQTNKLTDSTVEGYRIPTDGYAYYDTSTKKFYIDADYDNNGTITRQPINANHSDSATLAQAAVYETTNEVNASLNPIRSYYAHNLSRVNDDIQLLDGDGRTLGDIIDISDKQDKNFILEYTITGGAWQAFFFITGIEDMAGEEMELDEDNFINKNEFIKFLTPFFSQETNSFIRFPDNIKIKFEIRDEENNKIVLDLYFLLNTCFVADQILLIGDTALNGQNLIFTMQPEIQNQQLKLNATLKTATTGITVYSSTKNNNNELSFTNTTSSQIWTDVSDSMDSMNIPDSNYGKYFLTIENYPERLSLALTGYDWIEGTEENNYFSSYRAIFSTCKDDIIYTAYVYQNEDDNNKSYLEISSISDKLNLALNNYLPLSGGTMTGNLILNTNPSLSMQAANKQYVDIGLSTKLNINDTAYRTVSIPMGQVDDTSTATAFTATISGITELRDGVCILLKNGVITSASGCTLNINNLGAKPIYQTMAAESAVTTTFNKAYTMLFIYNSSRISGGCWDMYYGYYANTNTLLRTYASSSANELPLVGVSTNTSMGIPSHTSNYKDLYGGIPATKDNRPTVKLSTGEIKIPGGITTNTESKLNINKNTSNIKATLDISKLTANQTFSFPNKTGTIALTDDIPTLTSLGLDSAMHFIGTSSSKITDGGTENPTISGYTTKTAGDVVLYNNQEFVWTKNNKWELLGDEGSYKIKQTVINDNDAVTISGENDTFVTSVTQDANGVISVNKQLIKGETYLINVTMSSLTQGTSDKSSAEIAAALAANKLPIVKTSYARMQMIAPLSNLLYDSDEDAYYASFEYNDQFSVRTENNGYATKATMVITGTTVIVEIHSGSYLTTFELPDFLNNAGYATNTNIVDSINALNVTNISGFGAGKTLKTLTETNGKIAATFQDIAITKSQITDFPGYWANIATTTAASYNKEPEFKTMKLGNGTSTTGTKSVQLVYDATLEALNFVFA